MADSNVTITKSGVTFTFSDGDVERVNSDISAQLDIMPLPAGAPANTFLLDLGGAKAGEISRRSGVHPPRQPDRCASVQR